MFVVELIVLHVLSKENVCLAVYEALHHHVHRMFVRYHRVFYPMEYYNRTFHLFCHFKIVKSLIQKQVNYPAIILTSNNFDRFNRTNENKRAAILENTSQVTSRPWTYWAAHDNDLILWNVTFIPKKCEYQFSIAQNLFWSLLFLSLAVSLLIHPISRVLNTYDINIQFLINLLHELLRVPNILSIGMKMDN